MSPGTILTQRKNTWETDLDFVLLLKDFLLVWSFNYKPGSRLNNTLNWDIQEASNTVTFTERTRENKKVGVLYYLCQENRLK
jgi:hypothetical protein